MGSCLSKKSVCANSTPVSIPEKIRSDVQTENKKKPEEETIVKKEIFIIKHRKSLETERPRPEEVQIKKAEAEVENKPEKEEPGIGNGVIVGGGGGAAVRTSSCTKEEVDAILIQCGRLSRSSSTGGRKYSGSKRSYDFDNEGGRSVEGDEDERENRHRDRDRERRRQSQGRRRTPSRERERDQIAGSQQRSGSGGGGGGRRVSRSPGRRSESPITSNGVSGRPGKLVSVPATVPSLANAASAGVKRIQVKRNVGGGGEGAGTRTAASPRARSPARIRGSSENAGGGLQPVSLSRSNSRKAEHSPYRRNPLAEIDTNVIPPQAQAQKPNATESRTENKISSSRQGKAKEQQQTTAQESKGINAGHVALNVISSSGQPENLSKPSNAAVARSRSSRLSRDLDNIIPESLSNPAANSYTALLLEDIHNFHQKNTTTTTTPPPPAGFSLPPCVTKACSILEAVADLNSSTGSHLSSTFGQRNPISDQLSNNIHQETKDPVLESEVVVKDDLMEPNFHKYVTVRRGGEELDEEESSGSNSFVGSQQQWLSSSSWEPNSAESTDRWTSSSSSRSGCRQREVSPMGLQRHMGSESGKGVDEGVKRQTTVKNQQSGVGRGRVGSRGPHMAAAAAASS